MNEFLSPEQIASAAFETKRRGGLDPESVREHLRAAADTVAALMDEREGLTAELEAAQTSLANVAEPVVDAAPADIDEETLTEQLGQHAARVLAEARAAAADRIAEAEAEADDIRAAAEELHAERSMAADATAQKIRDEADELRSAREVEASEAAAGIVAAAERDAEALRSASSLSRDEAGQEADRIIRDAEVTRRQILEDLARRRTAARRQIEQLRAGRERLMASHETVRRALDEITEELKISMSEARAAAETAGHSVTETTIEELEAEIETARLTGLLDTGPVPVVNPPTPTNKALTSKAIPTSTQPDEPSKPVARGRAEAKEVDEAAEESDADDQHASDDGATEAPAEAIGKHEASEGSTDDEHDDDGDGSLAPVVSLDKARSEVETGGHPAAGRDATNIRSSDDEDQDAEDKKVNDSYEQDESVDAPVEAETVSDEADDDIDESDSVDALFASLRSSSAIDDDVADADDAQDAANDDKQDDVEAEPDEQDDSGTDAVLAINGSEGTRRLKRVLADEQSRVMSTLKGSDEIPSVYELLGDATDQVDQYWAASSEYLGGGAAAPHPVVDFVNEIRRKVADALSGDTDSEAAVDSMRSIYREIKTTAVEACVSDIADGSTSAAS